MDVPIPLALGPNTADRFLMDPKRLGFYAARYTVAAKMLYGKQSILDVGCGDGLFVPTFLHDSKAKRVVGIDFDAELIAYANNTLLPAVHRSRPELDRDALIFQQSDFMEDNFSGYEGVACMDCIEHVEPDDSVEFVRRIKVSLKLHGMAIIGTPNRFAEHLGSPHSRTGHINSHSPDELRQALLRWFDNVALLGMNDGTLNVGHEHLWHYVIGVATV